MKTTMMILILLAVVAVGCGGQFTPTTEPVQETESVIDTALFEQYAGMYWGGECHPLEEIHLPQNIAYTSGFTYLVNGLEVLVMYEIESVTAECTLVIVSDTKAIGGNYSLVIRERQAIILDYMRPTDTGRKGWAIQSEL